MLERNEPLPPLCNLPKVRYGSLNEYWDIGFIYLLFCVFGNQTLYSPSSPLLSKLLCGSSSLFHPCKSIRDQVFDNNFS